MVIDVRFSFACRRKFEELEGEGPLRRHCQSCGIDVINLDLLSEEAREAVYKSAAKSPMRVCVTASEPLENTCDCTTSTPAPPLPPYRPPLPAADNPVAEAETPAERPPNRPGEWWKKFKFW